jgi:DNA-binding winged helix-turn-helix (wHTH) protein
MRGIELIMNQVNEEAPMIVAKAGPYDGRRWIITDEIIMGRDQDCDIVIPNRQVSRHHVRIFTNQEGTWIEDLSSKNGTHHNGSLITEPHILKDGDIIQVALAQQFLYLSSDATMPLNGDFENLTFEDKTPKSNALRVEKRSRRVWINNQEVVPPLSLSQYKLLEILYSHPEQVVSRMEIIESVWGEENAVAVSDQALDALVRRLRDRIAEFDPNHQYIVTVRGHGLRLENPNIGSGMFAGE